MKEQQRSRILRISVTALMTAVLFWGNSARITIPLAIGGTTSITLGNIFGVLAGFLLGPAWGFLAAGLGPALYDLFNPIYAPEAWITFFTKGVYGLVAGWVLYKVFVRRLGKAPDAFVPQLVSGIAAALSYLVIYSIKNFFYNGWIISGFSSPAQCWALVIQKLPATLVNGAVAAIVAPILGTAIWKGLRAAGLEHMLSPAGSSAAKPD